MFKTFNTTLPANFCPKRIQGNYYNGKKTRRTPLLHSSYSARMYGSQQCVQFVSVLYRWHFRISRFNQDTCRSFYQFNLRNERKNSVWIKESRKCVFVQLTVSRRLDQIKEEQDTKFTFFSIRPPKCMHATSLPPISSLLSVLHLG